AGPQGAAAGRAHVRVADHAVQHALRPGRAGGCLPRYRSESADVRGGPRGRPGRPADTGRGDRIGAASHKRPKTPTRLVVTAEPHTQRPRVSGLCSEVACSGEEAHGQARLVVWLAEADGRGRVAAAGVAVHSQQWLLDAATGVQPNAAEP